MKRILNTCFLIGVIWFATVATVSAQIPRQFSYQGSIADGSGNAVTGSHSITVKIYSPANAVLFSETFPNVQVSKGIFSIVIGSSTPIPLNVAFDAQYMLGVSVDGGVEMTPQTLLTSAPYALMAGSLSANAAVVSSLNTQSGAITLQGGGGTTVTNNGSTFTISSSGGGGTGIQGVQNADGSLDITNPNGPTATISIANNGVKMTNIAANAVGGVQILGNCISDVHIADGAISVSKLKGGAATNGQVLTWNGSMWAPASGSGGGGLTLPYTNTVSDNNTLFALTNSGTGNGISGKATSSGIGVLGTNGSGAGSSVGTGVCGTSSANTGVRGNTNDGDGVNGYAAGTGIAVHGTLGSGATTARAGVFEINNSSSSGNTLEATNAGSGKAGYFRISNSSSTSPAVHISNASSSSDGLYAEANYNAVHGFSHSVSMNKSGGRPQINGVWNGVFGETDYTYGYGVKGLNSSTGSGIGVYGYCANGYGVYGQTDTNVAVYGYGNSGYGVYGSHESASGSKAGVAGFSSSVTAGSGTDGTVGAVGVFGELTSTSGVAWAAAVRGVNLSTSGSGVGVYGIQNGSGYGVYGYAPSGDGVVGSTSSGVGVYGSTSSGTGVYGSSLSGTGGRFYTGSSSATVYAVYSDGHAYKSDGNASWSIPSDENLKQNIRPFNDGLNVITQINPITYQYNGKAGTRTGEEHIGVLAQEMQTVAPYTVAPMKAYSGQDDTTGTDILSYNPSALTYIQINAIKELDEKINTLQSQMAQMQNVILVLTETLKANGVVVPDGLIVKH